MSIFQSLKTIIQEKNPEKQQLYDKKKGKGINLHQSLPSIGSNILTTQQQLQISMKSPKTMTNQYDQNPFFKAKVHAIIKPPQQDKYHYKSYLNDYSLQQDYDFYNDIKNNAKFQIVTLSSLRNQRKQSESSRKSKIQWTLTSKVIKDVVLNSSNNIVNK